MDKIGRGLGLAAALAVLGLTGSIARADDAAPPPHGSSLGIATSRLSDTWREKNAYRSTGVMVVGVDPSGRAAKGGITPGDVLVSVDGRTLREPSDLGYAERSIKADRPVPVVLAKDGGHSIKMFDLGPVAVNELATPPVAIAQGAALPVVTSESAPPPVATTESAAIPASVIVDPAPNVAASEPAAGAAIIIARGAASDADSAGPVATAVVPDSAPAEATKADTVELGVRGQALTPELAAAVGATGLEGVLVLEVTKESPAHHAGVQAGDVIFKIGDQPVKDVESMNSAVAATTLSPISISMLRLGKQQVVLAPFGEAPEVVPVAEDPQQQLNQLKAEVKSLHKEVDDLRAQLAKLLDSSRY